MDQPLLQQQPQDPVEQPQLDAAMTTTNTSSSEKLLLNKDTTLTDNGHNYSSFPNNNTDNHTIQHATQVAEEHKTTATEAVIHVLKGNIGPGCLSLPWAFSQLGLWWGIVSCIILCYWCTYCSWMTVVIKRHYPESIHTYPDVGTWAYGPAFGRFVRLCVSLQQTAICTVYISFAGANLLAAWNGLNHLSPTVQHVIAMTMALPLVMALSSLASLRTMAPFSALGGLTLATGIALIGIIVVQDWSSRPMPPPSFAWHNAPQAVSAVLFSYEGISLVMPIETSMAKPQQFRDVFWGSKVVVCSTFILVAGTCILAFGHVANGSITAFLLSNYSGHGTRYYLLTAANTVTGLSVLLTYPLQMFPALQLVGPYFAKNDNGNEEEDVEDVALVGTDNGDTNGQNGTTTGDSGTSSPQEQQQGTGIPGDTPWLRLGYVLTTYLVAVLVPNVQLLISLVGALAGSSTALLIPPLVEYEFRRRHHGSLLSKSRCLLVFGLGVCFMVVGTTTTVISIVQAYTTTSS